MNDQSDSAADTQWRYSQLAMSWSGWGSPVGAGIFVVALAAAALLIRLTVFGF